MPFDQFVSVVKFNSVTADDEELLLKVPTNFQEAQAVKATLAMYKENCSGLVIALMICLYLFMQVGLCIHATVLLSIQCQHTQQ